MELSERRGEEGLRWTVAPHGYAGRMEVYLAVDLDGVRLHYLLSLDPVDGRRLSSRAAQRLRRSYIRRAKLIFWAVKDEVERRTP